jgi:hypothetical protein
MRSTLELSQPPAPLNVGEWTLVVDEISPTGDAKHTLQLPQLKDWREIQGIESAVGSGHYTASPVIPESWLTPDLDVMIEVGAVAGAMQLTVNNKLVTKQTTPGGSWSIKSLLTAGKNSIEVRLDTTLLNRIAQSSSGSMSVETAPSGLLGPVRLIPVALGRIP